MFKNEWTSPKNGPLKPGAPRHCTYLFYASYATTVKWWLHVSSMVMNETLLRRSFCFIDSSRTFSQRSSNTIFDFLHSFWHGHLIWSTIAMFILDHSLLVADKQEEEKEGEKIRIILKWSCFALSYCYNSAKNVSKRKEILTFNSKPKCFPLMNSNKFRNKT